MLEHVNRLAGTPSHLGNQPDLSDVTFQRLDATWLAMGASYMEFNSVLKRLRADVEAALAARPGSMDELRAKLARQV